MHEPENQPSTKLTVDECVALAATMNRKYSSFLKGRHFEISVRSDRQGIYATVTLLNESKSFYYPVDGRIADLDHNMNERDASMFLLDYIDSYFEEYFREGGEVYLPIDWANFDWEGIPLQVKGQVLNLEIEALADRWLESGGRIETNPDLKGNETLH